MRKDHNTDYHTPANRPYGASTLAYPWLLAAISLVIACGNDDTTHRPPDTSSIISQIDQIDIKTLAATLVEKKLVADAETAEHNLAQLNDIFKQIIRGDREADKPIYFQYIPGQHSRVYGKVPRGDIKVTDEHPIDVANMHHYPAPIVEALIHKATKGPK